VKVLKRPGKYSPAFKDEATQFVLHTERRATQIAPELEIDNGTLSNWVNVWKLKNVEPLKALTPIKSAAVNEMESEIRRLRREIEFLKKQQPSSPRRNPSREPHQSLIQPLTARN
jgi:transposase